MTSRNPGPRLDAGERAAPGDIARGAPAPLRVPGASGAFIPRNRIRPGPGRPRNQTPLPLDDILAIFEGTADGVYVVDAQQRVIAWSDEAARLLGARREDVLGRRCFDVIAGDDYDGNRYCRPDCPVIVGARNSQPAASYDVLACGGGGRTWINVSIVVLKAAELDEPVAVHLFRDVSQRRKAEILARETIEAVSRFGPAPDAARGATRAYPAPAPQLTPREIEVLRLLASGLTVKEIAADLVLSQATIRNHIENLMGKLGVHSRLQAVVYAAHHNLL